jgi:hypothetical protein
VLLLTCNYTSLHCSHCSSFVTHAPHNPGGHVTTRPCHCRELVVGPTSSTPPYSAFNKSPVKAEGNDSNLSKVISTPPFPLSLFRSPRPAVGEYRKTLLHEERGANSMAKLEFEVGKWTRMNPGKGHGKCGGR